MQFSKWLLKKIHIESIEINPIELDIFIVEGFCVEFAEMLSCHIIKPLLDTPEMSFKHYFHSLWAYFLYNFVAQLYFCMQNSFQSFRCLSSIRKVCRLKRNISLKWPQTWMIFVTNITKRINTELMLYMRNV